MSVSYFHNLSGYNHQSDQSKPKIIPHYEKQESDVNSDNHRQESQGCHLTCLPKS
jgi:hypothetical protein